MFKGFFLVVSSLVIVLATTSGALAQDQSTYRVTGVIKSIPHHTSSEDKEILVKHDPIPEYRDEAGNVVGMAAMTMPFYIPQDLRIDSLSVGDQIELVVEQRFKPRFSERVVSLNKVRQAATK